MTCCERRCREAGGWLGRCCIGMDPLTPRITVDSDPIGSREERSRLET